MPLTKEHFSQIFKARLNAPEGYRFYHGYTQGLDNPWGDDIVTSEIDYTTYHVLITRDQAPVDKLDSHIPEEIEKFIQKWLDKDFKFD